MSGEDSFEDSAMMKRFSSCPSNSSDALAPYQDATSTFGSAVMEEPWTWAVTASSGAMKTYTSLTVEEMGLAALEGGFHGGDGGGSGAQGLAGAGTVVAKPNAAMPEVFAFLPCPAGCSAEEAALLVNLRRTQSDAMEVVRKSVEERVEAVKVEMRNEAQEEMGKLSEKLNDLYLGQILGRDNNAGGADDDLTKILETNAGDVMVRIKRVVSSSIKAEIQREAAEERCRVAEKTLADIRGFVENAPWTTVAEVWQHVRERRSQRQDPPTSPQRRRHRQKAILPNRNRDSPRSRSPRSRETSFRLGPVRRHRLNNLSRSASPYSARRQRLRAEDLKAQEEEQTAHDQLALVTTNEEQAPTADPDSVSSNIELELFSMPGFESLTISCGRPVRSSDMWISPRNESAQEMAARVAARHTYGGRRDVVMNDMEEDQEM